VALKVLTPCLRAARHYLQFIYTPYRNAKEMDHAACNVQ